MGKTGGQENSEHEVIQQNVVLFVYIIKMCLYFKFLFIICKANDRNEMHVSHSDHVEIYFNAEM